MKNIRFDNRGFTLVELLVAGLLIITILGAVMTLYVKSAREEMSLSNKLDIFAQGRKAYLTMSDELKMGTAVLQPSEGKTAPFVLFTNIKNELICYFLEADPKDPDKRRLRRLNYHKKEGEGRLTTLVDNVTDLKFTRKRLYEVAVRMFFKAGKKDRLPLATSVMIRNYIDPIDIGPEKLASSSID